MTPAELAVDASALVRGLLREAPDAEELIRQVSEGTVGLSAYDAFYVALADVLDVPLVTADRRLGEATARAVLVGESVAR